MSLTCQTPSLYSAGPMTIPTAGEPLCGLRTGDERDGTGDERDGGGDDRDYGFPAHGLILSWVFGPGHRDGSSRGVTWLHSTYSHPPAQANG